MTRCTHLYSGWYSFEKVMFSCSWICVWTYPVVLSQEQGMPQRSNLDLVTYFWKKMCTNK
jgi:hypothetical protein